MNHISPSQILQFLPIEHTRQIELRYESGALAAVLDRDQVLYLSEQEAVSGVLDKRCTKLRCVRPLISIRAIYRMVGKRPAHGGSIVAEDCRTINYHPGANGGTYSHNLKRSYAYAHDATR